MKIRLYIATATALMVSTLGVAQDTLNRYSLSSCIKEGLEKNFSILISRNDQIISSNNASWANAGMLPSVDLSAGYSGQFNDTESTGRDGSKTETRGTYNNTINAGVSLGWTIFDGFSIRTNYDRLKEMEKRGELNTRIEIEDFIASLTAEYYNYVQQTIRLKNFRYAVSLSKERLRIVEARYQIGSHSRLDLMQARVDFNADSSKYIDQQQLVYASRIRLNELMSDSKVTRFFIAADTSIVVNEGLEFASLNDNMLRTNTSLIEAASQQRLAELDVKTALSRNYPYLKLNAAYGYTQNRYGSGTTKANWSMGPSGGLSLGWTIFDGNRRREQKNARIMLANAKLQQQQIELSLRANLANFWQAYCNNIELTNLEKENLTAAKENHEIAMERYLLGDLSGIEMREAQKSLLDAEERILSAQYNTKLCEISLMQISGRILEYIDNITK